MKLASFLLFAAAPGYAQFALFAVDSLGETPVPTVYKLGSFRQNESVSTRFRLRNPGASRAPINVLAADGESFTLSGVPPLPTSLDPGAALDFTVHFLSPSLGAYSATLRSDGISVLLTATVIPSLTYSPLGPDPVTFGSIERGTSTVRQFTVENLTPVILTVPAISIQGAAFSLIGSPSGAVLQPLQSAPLEIRFQPPSTGPHQALLTIDDRTYLLVGTSFDPALPRPLLAIDLPQPRSAQQGTLTLKLDAPSRTTGAGTVKLEFLPLTPLTTDPGVIFAAGSLTVPFTVAPGDTQPLAVPFQTGTTAGTLVFTATLGGVTDRQTLTIPAAPITVSSATAARTAATIELRVTAFDNTRTAGPIAYTFFDAAGAPIPPGAIRTDTTADFSRFFQTGDAGGTFLLRSTFPVTGAPSAIAAFEIEFTNSAGTARTSRTPF